MFQTLLRIRKHQNEYKQDCKFSTRQPLKSQGSLLKSKEWEKIYYADNKDKKS